MENWKMTDQQILELASSYLRELYSGDVGDVVWQPLQEDALLNFAQAIYEIGNENGWESHQESVSLNSSYPTDYNYD
jgi:hypothetical protein